MGTRRGLNLLIASVLLAATCVVFWRVLDADFVRWDDPAVITENPNLGRLSWSRVVWAFTDFDSTLRYVPLTLLGWSATYTLWGLDPFGYHAGNLVLHGASTVLVFVLAHRLMFIGRNRRAAVSTSDIGDDHSLVWPLLGAALAAMLWSWHPLRVEAVAWVTARSHDQAAMFLLLSVLLYVRAVDTGHPGRRRWRSYGLSVISYVLATLSHPVGLSVPAALMILDIWPLRQFRWSRTMWRDPLFHRCLLEKIPFFLAALGALIPALMARFHHSGLFAAAPSLEEFGVIPRVMQAVYLLAYYAWRPLWPVHLAPVYTTLVDFSPWEFKFVASAVAVILVTAALIIVRRRAPALLMVWLIHLVLLLPVLGWTDHPHYPADRYSLLDGVPFSILIGAGFAAVLSHASNVRRWILASVASLVVGLLVVLSMRQVMHWTNSITLFEHTIAELGDDPYRADLLIRLGPIRDEQGDEQGGMLALQQALEIDPNNVQALDFLAQLHWNHHRPGDAAMYWERELKLQPDQEQLRCNLAMALAQSNDTQRGIQFLMDGLQTGTPSLDIRYMLGMLLAKTGKVDLAVKQFEYVLSIDPNHAPAVDALRLARQRLQQQQPQR